MAGTWVRHGSVNGWRFDGTLLARDLPVGGSFWGRALRVLSVADGGRLDRVVSYGDDPMVAGLLGGESLGPPGRGLASLIDTLPRELALQHLGPLFELTGLALRPCPGVGSMFVRGLRPATKSDLVMAFRMGEQERFWHRETPGALRASTWAGALEAVLAEPACRRSLVYYWSEVLRMMIEPEVAPSLSVLPYTAPHQPQHQRAAAVYLALAHLDPPGARRVLETAGPDAHRMLDTAARPGTWSPQLGAMVGRVRVALDGIVWA